jgi:hypothetical protein
MNLLFQFGDEHPKEVEELWAALCVCWPQNLRIIIRYLFIVSALAPAELIDYVSVQDFCSSLLRLIRPAPPAGLFLLSAMYNCLSRILFLSPTRTCKTHLP